MADEVQQLLHARRYREALERMVDLYGRKVFHLAIVMLKDRGRAEEITQDVFLKLWKALPGYDGRAAPSTWLYAIARNTCVSAIRAESYRRTVVLDASNEPMAAAGASSTLLLEQCVARLPEEQRAAITLFYWEDKSVKEVAALLDVPEGTVKSHLHRARRALGEMMEKR